MVEVACHRCGAKAPTPDERVMESLLQAKLGLQHAIDTINSDGKKHSRLRRLEEPGSGKSYEAAANALGEPSGNV